MKALIKYFFSAFFLLLSGHSFLFAQTNQNCISYSTNSLKTSANVGFASFQNNQSLLVTSISSSREKENDDLNDLFVDDDDDDSFKKHLGNNNYSTSILCTQTLGSIFSFNKVTLSLTNYLSNTSFYKYIVFRSFRI